MRRIAFLLIATLYVVGAQAQDAAQVSTTRVTVEDCYAWARANYPLVEQLNLADRAEDYNLANAAKGWLPQVSVSAQASYQSDVTQLPFEAAQLEALGMRGVDIPTLSRDQYGARVDVGQVVWDGGAIGAARRGVRAAAEVERAAAEVTLYTLNERVNGLFFGILLTGEQLARLDILTRDLSTTLGRVEALVRGGLATEADANAIRVELLKAAQQRIAIDGTRRAYVVMLATLCGKVWGAETEFVRPVGGGAIHQKDLPPRRPQGAAPLLSKEGNRLASQVEKTYNPEAASGANGGIARPEMALFEAQMAGIEARKHTLDATVTPRVSLFATGGYGRPALNMLANKFEPYYVVGARLAWNIGGLYTRRNDLRRLALDRRGVELRREAFLLNTDLDITLTDSNITRLREQLRLDDEIIALREAVLRSSEAKISGGTLSGSDLARDINALEAARQDKLLHEMELLMAIYNLKFATNN